MRGRNFKMLRAAADACVDLQVRAATAQTEGSRHRAANMRWCAARRALMAEAAVRTVYGHSCRVQMLALGRLQPSDYLPQTMNAQGSNPGRSMSRRA